MSNNIKISDEVLLDCKKIAIYCSYYGDATTSKHMQKWIRQEDMPIAVKMAWQQGLDDYDHIKFRNSAILLLGGEKVVPQPVTGHFEAWLQKWQKVRPSVTTEAVA